MARTRALDYAAKQDSLLRAAARLFADHGYAGTSIAMIATSACVSKALFYHYYPDKEAVLFDLVSSHLEKLISAVDNAAAIAAPGDRLFAVSAALLDAYRDADDAHKVQLANMKFLPFERQEELKALERQLVAVFAGIIAEDIPAIGHGPLLKPMTMSLFGMLNWNYLWFREGRGLTRADYARLVTALVANGAAAAASAIGEMPA